MNLRIAVDSKFNRVEFEIVENNFMLPNYVMYNYIRNIKKRKKKVDDLKLEKKINDS